MNGRYDRHYVYFFTYLLFFVAAVQDIKSIATSSFNNCLVLGPFKPII